MKFNRIVILALTAAAILSSCAQIQQEDSSEAQRRVREAWIRMNHPGLQPTESGMYILENVEGTGSLVPDDSCYCFVNYTIQTLDGTYSNTNQVSLLKKLGLYSDTLHYSPSVWSKGTYSLFDCEEEMLAGMRVGGKITALVPPELTLTTYPDDIKDIMDSYYGYSTEQTAQYSTNIIYTIELVDFVEDITEYENNQLKEFSDKYYGGMDTLSDGFYFKKLVSLPDADTIANNTSVYVNYIGKLLDGYCFDTNIQDTAKSYRRSWADKSPITITYQNTLEDFKNDNSYVDGFSKAIVGMKLGESAICFFRSDFGYSYQEKTNSIPAYSPLWFYIELKEKEDD